MKKSGLIIKTPRFLKGEKIKKVERNNKKCSRDRKNTLDQKAPLDLQKFLMIFEWGFLDFDKRPPENEKCELDLQK